MWEWLADILALLDECFNYRGGGYGTKDGTVKAIKGARAAGGGDGGVHGAGGMSSPPQSELPAPIREISGRSSYQGVVTREPSAVLREVVRAGESRSVKPANLANARQQILQKGPDSHAVQLYRSGGVKDGWHHLNALAQLQREGQIPLQKVIMAIVD